MRAAITRGPGLIELSDVAPPMVGDGRVLVRVERVGICGSDKHLYLGSHPYSTFPLIQGHELSGTVESLPYSYEGALRPGDRVAVEPLLVCGACYPCLHDQRGCCTNMQVYGAHLPGGFQELIAVPSYLLHPTVLSPELAALVEPMSIGVHAVRRARLMSDDEVLVLGAGPIGLSVLFGARELGVRVLLVDPLPNRLALAAALGADVLEWTNGEETARAAGEWAEHGAPTVAVDATGLAAGVEAAFQAVIAAGRVIVVGQSKQQVTLPVAVFTAKELNVLGAQNNNGIFARTLEMVEREPAFVQQMISHRFPLTEVREAFELAVARPDEAVKIVVDVTG